MIKTIEALDERHLPSRSIEGGESFLPAVETDLPEIRSLLLAAFHAGPDAPFADIELLRWKYFWPRPGVTGPRSFILKRDGRIVAFCGTAPLRFISPREDVDGICFMDWAARRDARGAGSALVRRLMRMNRLSMVIWGTESCRAASAKLEFASCGCLEHFLRIVRPWSQLLACFSVEPSWRACARLARNLLWSLSPLPPAPEGWSVAAVSRFGPGDWYNPPVDGFMLTWRDPELLNYWLRCPQGAFTGFLLSYRGRPCGYFLLSRIEHRAHIADIRVDMGKPRAWEAAYALAIRKAAEDAGVHAVLAVASTPAVKEMLRRNGFHSRGRGIFSLYAPSGVMSGQPPIHWSSIDDDSAFF